MNGALTFKPDVLAKRLDDKATNLVWDALADPKLNPSSGPEAKADKRYRDGFKDIVSNHFLKKTEQKCVIVLVSHSDGIPPFIKTYCPGLQMADPGYCATIAVQLASVAGQ